MLLCMCPPVPRTTRCLKTVTRVLEKLHINSLHTSFSIYKGLLYLLSYLLLFIETCEVGKPAIVQLHLFQFVDGKRDCSKFTFTWSGHFHIIWRGKWLSVHIIYQIWVRYLNMSWKAIPSRPPDQIKDHSLTINVSTPSYILWCSVKEYREKCITKS